MQNGKISAKQLVIQIGINIVASAIVSYIMYKALSPKEESKTAVKSATQESATTKAAAPVETETV